MDYDAWEKTVPAHIQQDSLWALRVYRTALFAGELARRDVAMLRAHAALDDMPSQLARATRSISVNIAEGYSRLSKRDKGRYYEYALGSAREARDWYYKVTEELGPPTADQRLGMLTMIIRVLTKLASQCRPVMEESTPTPPPPTAPPPSTRIQEPIAP